MSVVVPVTVAEACAALAERPGATVLAGGTDLMVPVNAGRSRPDDVVAVGRIAELRAWRRVGDEVELGAAVTWTTCAAGPLASLVPVLAQAARSIGSPQIRNAGTVGGNLATASPAGDGVVALCALGATVRLRSVAGARELAVEDFVTGPRATARRPDELIEAVRVPVGGGPQEFLKVGTRNAMVIAVASAALVVDEGRWRLALGSVGPGPVRAHAAERFAESLEGHVPPPGPDRRAAAARFGALAAVAASPIDDHRGRARYRTHAVSVLAARAATRAWAA